MKSRNSMSQNAFDAQSRKELLDSIQELEREYQVVETRLLDEQLNRKLEQTLELRLQVLADEISHLTDKYRDQLPIIPVSRCPFCKSLFLSSIDTFGLDGLWWNYDAPTRQDVETTCPHFLFLDGAVKLSKQVELVRFSAVLGPDVPFVIPRILEVKGLVAVITRICIGQHHAYPIVYFADPIPYDLELSNEWGASYYISKGSDVDDIGNRIAEWRESPCLEEDYDFDLGPWIRNRKLFWIKPDDPDLELHTDLIECPFLDLSGHQKIQYLSFDEVTTEDGEDG
jgi:hypothetical protein